MRYRGWLRGEDEEHAGLAGCEVMAACIAERRSRSWSDRAPSISSSFVTRCLDEMACEAKPSQGSRGRAVIHLVIGENVRGKHAYHRHGCD